jgi:hypothetical protein
VNQLSSRLEGFFGSTEEERLGTKERVTQTYNTIRKPIARIATDACASVYAPRWLFGKGHQSCVRASTEPAKGVHIRMLDGSVHMRNVPVSTDRTPDNASHPLGCGNLSCEQATHQLQLIGADYP